MNDLERTISTGVYYGIPEDLYHSWDFLSSSYLKKLGGNPASAKIPTEVSQAMRIGSAVHCLVLEGNPAFHSKFIVAPECDRRTKEGKETWLAFQSEIGDKTIITQGDYTTIMGCCNSILDHPLASKFLTESNGKSEVSLVWDDEETGIRCKARLDRLPDPKKRIIFDLKTTADSSKKGFLRTICNYNYDIQAGHYINGAIACGFDVDAWIFIAVQTSGTYPVTTAMISDTWLEWSRLEAKRLIRLENECRKVNIWPNFELPQGSESPIVNPNDLLEVFEMPPWR